jgi:Ca2+/Na+ antiporter
MKPFRSLAILLGVVAMTACDKDAVQISSITAPATGARVKFFNFGVNAPQVNFFANTTKVTAISSTTGTESTVGVAYGAVAAGGFYMALPTGAATFQGRISATVDNNLPISSVPATLEDGKSYSVYLSGFYNTATKQVENEYAEGVPARSGSLLLDGLFILGGLGILVIGARLLTDNSVALARSFGVSEAVIGLTIVAAGTSVPELAASIVAAMKKEPDIALGNVIGSNIFNILGILGIASMVAPITAPEIRHFDLWTMVAFAAALVPMLWTGLRVSRAEGAALFAAYCGYVYFLWPK